MPMSLKDKYAIVGIGYTDQGRVPGRSALSFYVEACANAIKEHQLRFQKCRDCQHIRWPPSIICPLCYSHDTEWIVASGKGRFTLSLSITKPFTRLSRTTFHT